MRELLGNFLSQDIEREVPLRIGILLLTTILLTTYMTAVVSDSYWSVLCPGSFSAGTEAPRSIQAPREYQLVDLGSTAKRRSAAISSQPKIFRHNDYQESRAAFKVAELFSSLREFAGLSAEGLEEKAIVLEEDQREAFERQSRIDLVGREWKILQDRKNWPTIEKALSS